MKTAAKKHGVIVTVGGRHNTKTVWNRGRRMVTYRKQPSRIRFRSKMVSDKNQHICGGWFYAGLENTSLWIERQLIAGRKPLGAMVFWNDDAAAAKACADRLRAAGLVVRVGRSFNADQTIVEACHDIRVGDIGDMGDLFADYVHARVPMDEDELRDQFNVYAGRRLKSFLGKKWDSPHCPLWVTGLILGYPVENTISIYHDAVS